MQLPLLGHEPPRADLGLSGIRRDVLAPGVWIDTRPGWVEGHASLFDALHDGTRWRHERRRMYDRIVDVPRLTARLPEDGAGHPLVAEIAGALGRHYAADLCCVSMALYRDGNDSVAWHRDRELRDLPTSMVAIVVLGEPRPFLLRPFGGGRSIVYKPGWGDLLVMGGRCQHDFEHGVPKVPIAGPRISVMFRQRRTTDGAWLPQRDRSSSVRSKRLGRLSSLSA